MAERGVLTIRLRPSDLRALDALAQTYDLSRDHLVRLLILREASRRTPARAS